MLERINNDNVNNGIYTKSNNDNVNNVDHKKVEHIALSLVEKFMSKDSYKFYCLVAYKLPENKIWLNYEKAMTGKNPAGLFNWLCRKDMSSN